MSNNFPARIQHWDSNSQPNKRVSHNHLTSDDPPFHDNVWTISSEEIKMFSAKMYSK